MPKSYRAQHIGSLLRPPELLQARAAHAAGTLPLEQLRAVEDQAILQALEKQRQLGLDVVTDGEFRRGSWLTDMADAVEGFVPDRVPLEWKGPGGGIEGSTAHAAGAKLRKTRKMTGYEVPFLKKNTHGPFKVTLPAPSNFMLASYKKGITDKFYPTHEDLLKDLVEIVRDDVKWLVAEGVQYIQFDAPFYSHYLDPLQRARMRQEGRSPDKELENAIAGDNAALREVPRASVTVGMHICRGNNKSRWFTEGGYDSIAEKLFGRLDVDRFLLEYDTARQRRSRSSNRRPNCESESTRLPSTCRWRTWRSARSADSHPRPRAICFPRTNNGRNLSSSWTPRAKSGARVSPRRFLQEIQGRHALAYDFPRMPARPAPSKRSQEQDQVLLVQKR
jgi:5-methyltetrahydropteroyltriglutamate--homocysteine methyltransferase